MYSSKSSRANNPGQIASHSPTVENVGVQNNVTRDPGGEPTEAIDLPITTSVLWQNAIDEVRQSPHWDVFIRALGLESATGRISTTKASGRVPNGQLTRDDQFNLLERKLRVLAAQHDQKTDSSKYVHRSLRESTLDHGRNKQRRRSRSRFQPVRSTGMEHDPILSGRGPKLQVYTALVLGEHTSHGHPGIPVSIA